MYKREEIIKCVDMIVDEIKIKIYGHVEVNESIIFDEYQIIIYDRNINFSINITENLHRIHNYDDIHKIVYLIIEQYKSCIIESYIC